MDGPYRDHYETLALPRDASPADIKRAYFRLVRVHSPENDPQGFQELSAAYAVLSDPIARAEFDSETPLPEGVEEALTRAASLCEKDPDGAVAAAFAVLTVKGLPVRGRLSVVAICVDARRLEAALRTIDELILESPNLAVAHETRGNVLRNTGRPQQAIAAFERALEADPRHAPAVLGLMSTLVQLDRHNDAIAAADKWLAAAPAATLGQAPVLMQKCVALACACRWDEIAAVVAAVAERIPPEDDDARSHVARHWVGLAIAYANAGVADVAHPALEAALALIEDPELRARANEMASKVPAQRDVRRAMNDVTVPDWISHLLPQHVGTAYSDSEWRTIWNGVLARVREDVPRARRQWGEFRRQHGAAATLLDPHWNLLLDQCARDSGARRGPGLGLALACVGLIVFYFRSCNEPTKRPSPTSYLPFTPPITAGERDRLWDRRPQRITLLPILQKLAFAPDGMSAAAFLSEAELTELRKRPVKEIDSLLWRGFEDDQRDRVKARLTELGVPFELDAGVPKPPTTAVPPAEGSPVPTEGGDNASQSPQTPPKAPR